MVSFKRARTSSANRWPSSDSARSIISLTNSSSAIINFLREPLPLSGEGSLFRGVSQHSPFFISSNAVAIPAERADS